MGYSTAMLVPHLNSIFTEEALVIFLVQTSYVSEDGRYFSLDWIAEKTYTALLKI